MARTPAQKKGDDLERAVQILETYILGSNPATKEADITIEPKKIVVVNNVRHEIDIYITIDLGKGYAAYYIFECKNWTKKVGKDEIIVFSKKIDVVHAQKGYFIAKSFTKDAKAQAEQDARVELLTATEELDTSLPLIADFHLLYNMIIDSHADFVLRPGQIFKPSTYTHESAVRYRNEDLLLRTFNERMQQRIVNEVMHNVPGDVLGKEDYNYTKTQTLVFQPHELTIEGQEIYRVDMRVTWQTKIVRPKIVSTFDIKTRGRVITYDSGELPAVGNIQFAFIATP